MFLFHWRLCFPPVYLPPKSRTILKRRCLMPSSSKARLSRRFGVIGLLEEFHSHHILSRFYLDMLGAYNPIEVSEEDGFFEWVRQSQSTLRGFLFDDFAIPIVA
jgi:hypothetical protein